MIKLKKIVKTESLLLYILISILFMDIIFRVATVNELLLHDLVMSLYFLIGFVFAFYLFCSFFQGTTKFVLATLILGFVALIYASQLVYYEFFRTLYSVYSLGNATQIFAFWRDIGNLIINHAIEIILICFPVILLIIFGKKFFAFEKSNWFKRIVLVCCLVLSHLVGVTAVQSTGQNQHSAYDLYYNSSHPLLSAERLGLLTTMRMDLQRLITGWSPELEAPVVMEPDDSDSTPEPSAPEEDKDESQAEVVEDVEKIEYNTMDIGFSQLIAEESEQVVKDMHKHFQSVQPTTKNEYTGKYKGYNLILITAEGFAPYAIHPDVTPTLYKMANTGYRFTNFYTPSWEVSTSDGEYVALQSLIPKSGVWSFQKSGDNELPFVLGNQLQKRGYKTLAYHNHTYTYYDRHISHPNMGYVYKGLGNGLDVKETWPESDLEMMEKTIPEYIDDEPFHAYYMTVSGHMQYSFTGNYIAWKNKEYVADLPYSEQAKAYLATQIELDRALAHLLSELEKGGIADETLIALSADHYPYGLDDETIDELVGHPVEGTFERYKNSFILYTKGMESETITKPASSLDILPTLSNLLGLEYDSRLLMGRDIFSDATPLVTFLDKSYITDKGRYNAVTDEFMANDGEQVSEAYKTYMSSIVQAKFYYSAKILEEDYYNKVFDPD